MIGIMSKLQALLTNSEDLEVGMGKVGMPLRVAVTGAGNSPSLDVTLHFAKRACSKVDCSDINKALHIHSKHEKIRKKSD